MFCVSSCCPAWDASFLMILPPDNMITLLYFHSRWMFLSFFLMKKSACHLSYWQVFARRSGQSCPYWSVTRLSGHHSRGSAEVWGCHLNKRQTHTLCTQCPVHNLNKCQEGSALLPISDSFSVSICLLNMISQLLITPHFPRPLYFPFPSLSPIKEPKHQVYSTCP